MFEGCRERKKTQAHSMRLGSKLPVWHGSKIDTTTNHFSDFFLGDGQLL